MRRSVSPSPPPETPNPIASREASPAPSATVSPAINPPAPIPASALAPRVDLPAEFSGKPSEYRNFMVKCNLIFTLCPTLYANDFQRTTFVLARLSGNAATYTRHISEDDKHPLRHDFVKFKEYLDNVYIDRNYRRRCAYRLSQLRQTKSVASYAIDFKTFVEPLEYGNNAKCDRFYYGLHPNVQEAIEVQGQAKLFDDLVDQAIRIDEAQYRAKSGPQSSETPAPRKRRYSEPYVKRDSPRNTHTNEVGQPTRRPSFQNPRPSSSSYPQRKPGFPSPPYKRFNPGSVRTDPHPPISDEVRKYRQENDLCLRCGRSGHWKSECGMRRPFEKRFERSSERTPEKRPPERPVIHAIVASPSPDLGNKSPRAPMRSEA